MSMILFGLTALMIGFVGGVILTAVFVAWLSATPDQDEAGEATPAWVPAPAAPAPTAAHPMTRGEGAWGRETRPEARRDWRGAASGAPRPGGYDTLHHYGYREAPAGKDVL